MTTVSEYRDDHKTDDVPFRDWMREVDRHVYELAGVSVHDLPDFAFRAHFDCGEEAIDVARLILVEEGFLEEE